MFAVGEAHEHLIGLARGDATVSGLSVIACATRMPLKLAARGGWGETTVQLPAGQWTDCFSGRAFAGTVRVAELFNVLPTALLVAQQLTEAGRL